MIAPVVSVAAAVVPGVYRHKSLRGPFEADTAKPQPPKSHKLPEASIQVTDSTRAPGALAVEAMHNVP